MELDKEGMRSDEVFGPIFTDQEDQGFVVLRMETPGGMLMFPEIDGQWNCILMIPYDEASANIPPRLDEECSRADFIEATKGASGLLKRLIPYTTDIVRWMLSARDPVKRFNNGRVVAVGDAAHASLPCMSSLSQL